MSSSAPVSARRPAPASDAAATQRGATTMAPKSTSSGASHNSSVCAIERRPQQHELAVAVLDELRHLAVAVARLQALAHEQAQIARERRVAVVDRLVLADEAAQAGRDVPRARFERRIGEDLVGLHRERRDARAAIANANTAQAPSRARTCDRIARAHSAGAAAKRRARPGRRRAGAGR